MDQMRSKNLITLIRYKIYLMGLVVLVLSLSIGGLSFWKESLHSEVEGEIYRYHMESVHDLMLLQKEIQNYQIQELSNGHDVLLIESQIRTNTVYNLRQIWGAIIKRQQHYKGKDFNVVVDKTHLQIQGFINILSKGEGVGSHGDKQIMKRIQPLLFSIEQLERLHTVSRHTLLEYYERGNKDSLIYLVILGIALVMSALLIAYYVSHIIRKYADL